MTFKELKQGYSIYILDKDAMTVKQGKVISVSAPHLDKKSYEIGASLVVDVMLDIDGVAGTYTFKDDTEIGYAQQTVITTDKQNILREVEIIKSQSEDVLSQVDKHKERLSRCNNILAEYNPAIKERKEIDERFGKLENSMVELKNMLSSLVTNNTQQL